MATRPPNRNPGKKFRFSVTNPAFHRNHCVIQETGRAVVYSPPLETPNVGSDSQSDSRGGVDIPHRSSHEGIKKGFPSTAATPLQTKRSSARFTIVIDKSLFANGSVCGYVAFRFAKGCAFAERKPTI